MRLSLRKVFGRLCYEKYNFHYQVFGPDSFHSYKKRQMLTVAILPSCREAKTVRPTDGLRNTEQWKFEHATGHLFGCRIRIHPLFRWWHCLPFWNVAAFEGGSVLDIPSDNPLRHKSLCEAAWHSARGFGLLQRRR